jgi:hypothetical protein
MLGKCSWILCYRRTLGEKYLHELAIAESRIEFFDRCVDQKENEDPNLSFMRSQFSREPSSRSQQPRDRFAAESSPHGDPSKLGVEMLPPRR